MCACLLLRPRGCVFLRTCDVQVQTASTSKPLQVASHTTDDSDDEDAFSHVRGVRGFKQCRGSWAFRLATPSVDSTRVAFGMSTDDATSQKATSVGHWAIGLDSVIK